MDTPPEPFDCGGAGVDAAATEVELEVDVVGGGGGGGGEEVEVDNGTVVDDEVVVVVVVDDEVVVDDGVADDGEVWKNSAAAAATGVAELVGVTAQAPVGAMPSAHRYLPSFTPLHTSEAGRSTPSSW
jgi:hypothetical protein